MHKISFGIMKFAYILFILLLPLFAQAQKSDSQLAYTYYQNKEYDKAGQLFFQLYERTRSSNYLDYYIVCLINGKQYDKAETALKKYLKTDDRNKEFLVNLGYVYEQQGKTKKSEEYYEKAVQRLIPSTSDVNSLANKFRNIREYGWAVKAYLQGQKILKQPNAFLRELGENYMLERDYENMLDLFIRTLQQKPGDINNVTSQLSFARSYDLVNNVDNLIEKKLEDIFKQEGYNPVFDELAVWYATQKKDYAQALRHATLLNQKMTDKENIFINIARNASGTGDYAIAAEAYRKVLEKGKENNNYYLTARKEILECKYEQAQKTAAGQESYRQIASGCEQFLQEYGYVLDNVDIGLLLSDIYAYRLNLPDSANSVLEKSTSIRRLSSSKLSMIKSKRADLLTFTDNLWEATILYTQIEKANPNNDIGYEAKLKKAWLAYYAGDLLWAKAQFDVLKGSTTKLISNDAIKMAHFINMNYDEDDNQDLEKLAKTEYLIYKQQIPQALPVLDSLMTCEQPGIADYAALLKAKIRMQQNQPENAAELLEKLKNESQQTYIRAEAIYQLANLKKQQQEFDRAKELYKILVSEYSGSVYSIEAGKLYREIKD